MSFKKVKIGDRVGGKKVFEVITLSSGEQIVKTENSKSAKDFRVKIISREHPIGFTIKHAHFAIDFYGKWCYNREKALKVLEAIGRMWNGEDVGKLVEEYEPQVNELPGYSLEYILYSLRWILEQEDINFTGRPAQKQIELDEKISKFGISIPENRKGSQLAIALLCDIASGTHPVEAFYAAGLKI